MPLQDRKKYLAKRKALKLASMEEEEKDALAIMEKYRGKTRRDSGVQGLNKYLSKQRIAKNRNKRRHERERLAAIEQAKQDEKKVVKKPVIKKTKPTDPNRGNKVPGIHSTEYLTTTPRPDFDKTKVKKADREKGLLIDKTTRTTDKKDDSSTLQKLFGPSKEKVEMGKDQMKRARASMGMKKGGKVKGYRTGGFTKEDIDAKNRKMLGKDKVKEKHISGVILDPSSRRGKLPKSITKKQFEALHPMKHGGVVKRTKMGKVRTANPRNIDGIAKRGLTRAKHR
jgi:hypothetical protein